eukprot:364636-Chlamydomonas_euryale.AAC.3
MAWSHNQLLGHTNGVATGHAVALRMNSAVQGGDKQAQSDQPFIQGSFYGVIARLCRNTCLLLPCMRSFTSLRTGSEVGVFFQHIPSLGQVCTRAGLRFAFKPASATVANCGQSSVAPPVCRHPFNKLLSPCGAHATSGGVQGTCNIWGRAGDMQHPLLCRAHATSGAVQGTCNIWAVQGTCNIWAVQGTCNICQRPTVHSWVHDRVRCARMPPTPVVTSAGSQSQHAARHLRWQNIPGCGPLPKAPRPDQMAGSWDAPERYMLAALQYHGAVTHRDGMGQHRIAERCICFVRHMQFA